MRNRLQSFVGPLGAMWLSIFLLSLMDALIKLTTKDLGTWQIVLLRYAFGALALSVGTFLFVLVRGGQVSLSRPRFTKQQVAAGALRAVFIVLTALTFFYALGALPLAQAVTLAFSAPIFMLLLSPPLLGERFSGRAMMAVLIGFGGILLIVGYELLQPVTNILPVFSALAASVFYAMAMILARKHRTHSSTLDMVFLQTWISLILIMPLGLVPLAEFTWQPPATTTLVLFVVIGALGTSGHLLLVWAFSHAPAGRIAPIEYTTLLWAGFFGIVMFREVPNLNTLAGAILIVFGCALAATERKMARDDEPSVDMV